MTSGDAGAAHGDDLFALPPADGTHERVVEGLGFEESPVRCQHGGEWQVARAGYVTGDRVDRFLDTAETRVAASVEEQRAGIEAAADCVGLDDPIVVNRLRYVMGRLPVGGGRFEWLAGCEPGVQSPVEYGDAVVSEPAQQPPESRCDSARRIVVGDDEGRALDAPCA